MARNPVIDLLRGWAIVGMTIWHFAMRFGRTRCDVAVCTPELNGLWHGLFYNGSSLSVPLFYFTAGMTLALNLGRHRGPQVAARAVQVILLGYALTFFVMGPDQWLHAFVLQSIGFGLLLMAAFSRWRPGAMALYVIALAATLYNLGKPQVLVPSVAAHESMLPVLFDGIRALVIDGGFALPWSDSNGRVRELPMVRLGSENRCPETIAEIDIGTGFFNHYGSDLDSAGRPHYVLQLWDAERHTQVWHLYPT